MMAVFSSSSNLIACNFSFSDMLRNVQWYELMLCDIKFLKINVGSSWMSWEVLEFCDYTVFHEKAPFFFLS